MSTKAMRRGLTLTVYDIDALIDKSDRKLFQQATQPGHSLHHLLSLKTFTYSSYQLRKRKHPYLLPTVQYSGATRFIFSANLVCIHNVDTVDE